ncbi:unnamed protein product [Acidithrix sp. C25]|nr:unnamed protein product [Acidithrix sp. C25]
MREGVSGVALRFLGGEISNLLNLKIYHKISFITLEAD